MIKTEDLRGKNYKLYIGLPMYGGMLTESTFHGMMQLQYWSAKTGVQIKVQTMGNESLITRARNTIVAMMLDDKAFDATHLLFIDSDIGFQPSNVERLVQVDKDIACGIYPRKAIHWNQTIAAVKENPDITVEELQAKSLGYNLNFDANMGIRMQDGFCKVNEAATGMMLVKKEVFTKMIKAFPEKEYKTDQIINGKNYESKNCYDLFSVGKFEGEPNGRYLSEDYYFSRLWQSLGGEIWADCASPLVHFGNMAFAGHVGSVFKKMDDKELKEFEKNEKSKADL